MAPVFTSSTIAAPSVAAGYRLVLGSFVLRSASMIGLQRRLDRLLQVGVEVGDEDVPLLGRGLVQRADHLVVRR